MQFFELQEHTYGATIEDRGAHPQNQERKLHMKRKQHVPASKIT
jgi:hypothetical protein